MSGSLHSRFPFHYAWVIVATGTLSILACLGFGRFALGSELAYPFNEGHGWLPASASAIFSATGGTLAQVFSV